MPESRPFRHSLPFLLAAVSLTSALPMLAATHEWVATGTVVVRSQPTATCIPNGVAGATFRFDWTFDDTAPDLLPGNPTLGRYDSVTSWRLRITNGASTDDFSGSGDEVRIFDQANDRYEMDGTGPSPDLGPCGAGPIATNMNLVSNDTLPFFDDSQPFLLLNVADFAFNHTLAVLVPTTPQGSLLVGMDIEEFYQVGAPESPILPLEPVELPDGSVVWGFTTTPGTPCTVDPCWFDPPMADGFRYETDGASRFTSIADFPSGFGQDFEVWTGGVLVGSFGPGQSVDFTGEPGGGVVEFTILKIQPLVDASDALAFPLQLTLNTVPASFTMTSIQNAVPTLPLPAVAALTLGLVGAASFVLRRPARKARRS